MQTPVAIDDFSAQLRFDSFKLGKPLPASMTMAHKHSRSHSRNASISLSTTLPTTNSMPTLASAAASSKRNSHHRRRSSVSTRHESAEIMGVSVPENIWEAKVDLDNTEKDSIRRRALWALEGKQVNLDKVEIPETLPTSTSSLTGSLMASSKRDSFKPSSSKDQLHTLVEEEEEEEEDSPVPVTVLPVMPKRTRPATLSLRPLSLIPDVGLPTPSSTPGARPGLKSLSLVPSNPSDDITSPTPSRSRPVLNLHIDSTVDEAAYRPTKRSSISYKSSSSSTSMSSAAGLPTPEMTPTFAERHNSLSLGSNASSCDEDLSPQQTNNANANPSAYSRHRPLSVSEQHFLFKSHNALLMRIQDLEKALSVRRSSMSSVSMSGSGSRPISMAYSIADSEASSEPSDEMLRLVADLKAERDELKRDVDGWRVRVGDLEAQISLLARRIEGERREAWVARSKVGLLEAEKGALERELAQVKDELRERDGEGEEQKGVRQENERLGRECEEWKREVERLRTAERRYTATSLDTDTSLDSSSTEVEEIDFGSFDNGYPLKAVEEEEQLDEDLLDSPQIPQEDIEEDYLSPEEDEDNGLAGYEDEDEELDLDLTSSSFGSVHEASAFQPRSLAHLENGPISPASPSGSGTNTPSTLTPGSRSPSASPTPMDAFKFPRAAPATAPVAAAAPTHRVIGSLSKTWTFPAAAARQQTQTPPSQSRDRDEVDKFFNCLEDSESDSSTAGSRSPVSPYTYDSEHNKGYSLFAKALEAFDEDDVMPFSLPPGVLGAIGQEEQESPRSLDVVFEEEEEEGEEETQVDDNEEDDNDMFGAGAGIMITVTPAAEDNDDDEYPSPQIEDSDVEEDEKDQEEQEDDEEQSEQVVQVSNSSAHFSFTRKPVPLFNDEFDEDENDVPFNFGHPLPLRSSTPPDDLPMSTPPRSTPSRSVRAPSPSTSSIPRPKSFINNFSSSSSTLVDSDSSFSSVSTSASIMSPSPPSKLPIRSSSFATPPTNTKRVGAAPSFIPQPAPASSVSFPSSSPSPMRKGPTLRERPSGTVASFIRQPARKTPLMAAASKTGHNDSDSIPNVFRSMTNVNNGPRFSSPSNRHVPTHADSADSSSVRSISRFEASYSRSIEAEAGDGLTSINSNSTPQSSSPSLSSIMTSPKLSFLSGFIPRPWESASVPGAAPVTKSKSNPVSRVYVSRDRQLERLRLRLQHDGSRFFSEDMCQRCDGAVVYL